MRSLKGSDTEFFTGAMFGFSLQPFPGFRAKWLSEITHIDDQRRFTDVQWEGPYAFWHHVHEVRAIEGGGSELIDRVFYKMPLGIVGSWLHGPMVKPGLKETFQYRHQKLSERFGRIEERPAQIVFNSL
jgi:ligand-binding SRPBCC domain-containing protein